MRLRLLVLPHTITSVPRTTQETSSMSAMWVLVTSSPSQIISINSISLASLSSWVAGFEGLVPNSWQHYPCRHKHWCRWSTQRLRNGCFWNTKRCATGNKYIVPLILLVNHSLVLAMYHGFDWYGRTLEVREVSLSSDLSGNINLWSL